MRFRRGCEGWPIMLAAVAADRITKAAARRLGPGTLIPGVLACRPARNTGIAFSMLSGHGGLLALVTAAAVLGILAWLIARPEANRALRAGLWLIAGGGLGNLYDRLAYGSVVDFLELTFVRFAIFNVADVCICVGAALALIGSVGKERGNGGI